VRDALNKASIFPRRYFYPSLNNLPYVQNRPMPVTESVAVRVLCLPLYHDLSSTDVKKIVDIVVDNLS
jgi:dTDP-4-amino-4,6-dideoxygalactose transaminase